MKKIICIFCVCFLLLGCGCAKKNSGAICLKPIEEFFAALNQGSYEKYDACHVPQVAEIRGSYAFEELYIDCRREMLGEKAIYKIIEVVELYEKEKTVLRTYCGKHGIENEDFSLVRLDSNLESLPHGCYLVQNKGKWEILSWYPISMPKEK